MADANMLVILLCIAPVRSLLSSEKKRYIPGVEAAEEIDASDVIFTTPSSDPNSLVYAVDAAPSKAISARAGSLPNRQRLIVPVISYHKVIRPLTEIVRHTGSNPLRGYDKKNYATLAPAPSLYKKFYARKKYIHGPIKIAGNPQSSGSKYIITPSRYLNAPGPSYGANAKGTPFGSVYYPVGDESSTRKGRYTDNQSDGKRFYNEKGLLSVKPNGKQTHRRKYLPYSGKTRNGNVGTTSGALSEYNNDDGTFPELTDGEDHLTSENSTHYETEGRSAAGRQGDSKARGGDRIEFQMYGLNGPNSYKFGYDTGKGDNRHFRFEERDNDGKIRGHYGYVDDDGKTRVVKYEADPETGFRAGPVEYSSNHPDE